MNCLRFLKQFLNSFYSARLQEGIPGSQVDTLQKLDVPVMNIDQCKRILNSTHRRENVREEKNLCAGGQKGYQYKPTYPYFLFKMEAYLFCI